MNTSTGISIHYDKVFVQVLSVLPVFGCDGFIGTRLSKKITPKAGGRAKKKQEKEMFHVQFEMLLKSGRFDSGIVVDFR